ncbi:MAG: Gfo/Idh/MocA family oxidoreductase [Acidaminobacteraceae bacterium]
MEKIRVGLVGCGRISYKHIEAIIEHSKSAKIVAVCDIIKERADEAALKTGAIAYTSYAEMLEKENLDMISICTPSGLHSDHGILAAKKGIKVLTEKPMATNINDADLLIKACDDNNVDLYVVKQNRLNRTCQLLKKAIDKNRFGKIYMSTVNVFWTRPQDYYDQAKWRGTWEFDGGAYMNQASHYVDMMSWLVGEVESVMAYTATLERNIEAEDSGVAAIKFRNGAMGSINVTMLTYPKNYEGSITIMGENGTVKLGGIALNKVEHWEFKDYDDDDAQIFESNYTPQNIYGNGHSTYYDNVFKNILGEGKPETDGRSGRKSLEIIQAIYMSSKDKKCISLPINL